MTKSKITLLFSILLTIYALICLIININKTPHSIYKEGTYTIKGIVKKCITKEDKTTITLSSKENILINDYNASKCHLGSMVKATGKLQKPNNNTVFNTFNYRRYLYSQHINYIMTVDKITFLPSKPSILYSAQNAIRDHIKNYQTKNYLETFILGDKSDIDAEVMNSYQNNGISHLLSISGMHISLLSLIILFALNKISERKIMNYLLVIVCLVSYATLTGLLPPVARATLLFIALTINKTFDLKIKTIYLLIIICDITIIYNPYIIYNIGFQFSYIVSFYLILFQKLIEAKKDYITKTFLISFIAFLAGIPIMIINFHQINLLSPLINVIFVPLVSVIVFPLSLITLIIQPLDLLLKIIIECTEQISLSIAAVDNFNIILKHINLIIVVAYYLVITGTLYCLVKRQIRGLVILSLMLFAHTNINYLNPYPFITMIDVGQGDSLLLSLPHNKGNILIDTGGTANFRNSFKNQNKKFTGTIATNTINYLKSEGIKEINYLIITHGDFDHIGEAENLINNYKIKNIILNSHQNNSLEDLVVNLAHKKHIPCKNINEGYLKINKYKLKFLKSNSQTENEDSLIIYTKMNNQNILLMGDAGEEREKYILKEYNLPKMDILKVGHHGSKHSTSPRFVNQIEPKISLISAGRNNLYGHPHKELLARLEDSKLLITQIDGSVKIVLKKRTIYYTCPLMR